MIHAICLRLFLNADGLQLSVAQSVPHLRRQLCSSAALSASASKCSHLSTSLCRHRRSLVPGSCNRGGTAPGFRRRSRRMVDGLHRSMFASSSRFSSGVIHCACRHLEASCFQSVRPRAAFRPSGGRYSEQFIHRPLRRAVVDGQSRSASSTMQSWSHDRRAAAKRDGQPIE